MKKIVLKINFILSLVVLVSCTTESSVSSKESSEASTVSDTLIATTHSILGEEFDFDTLLDGGLRIKIYEEELNSFVRQEDIDENETRIHDYPDLSQRIQITNEDYIVVDTILFKENFSPVLFDSAFLKEAIFYSYRFRRFDENSNEIVLFGTITKPETDATVAFYHRFSLSSQKFKLTRFVDQPI